MIRNFCLDVLVVLLLSSSTNNIAFADDAGAESRIWQSSMSNGEFNVQKGNHLAAISAYEQALSIAEKSNNESQIANTLHALGEEYTFVGRLAEGESTLRRGLQIDNRLKGEESEHSGYFLNTLGDVLCAEAKYDEAESALKKALEIRKHTYRPGDPRIGTTLGNLSEVYIQTGRYKEAEPILDEAIQIKKASEGANSESMAFLLNSYGRLCQRLEKPIEAEKAYKQSLEIRESIFGPKHPRVATGLNNMAEFYLSIDKTTEAEPLLLRALAILEPMPGNDLGTASILNNLGMLYLHQKSYVKADELLHKCLAIREKSLGENNLETAGTVFNLGVVFVMKGDFKAAQPFIDRAVAVSEKVAGPDHPQTKEFKEAQKQLQERISKFPFAAQTDMGLVNAKTKLERDCAINIAKAATLMKNGDYNTAIPLLEKLLKDTTSLEDANTMQATTGAILATAYQQVGDTAKEELAWNKSLAAAEKCTPVDAKLVTRILNSKATIEYKQGKYADSEQSLKKAIELETKTPGFIDPADVAVMSLLAQVHLKQGKYSQASNEIKQAVLLSEKRFGAQHPSTSKLRELKLRIDSYTQKKSVN